MRAREPRRSQTGQSGQVRRSPSHTAPDKRDPIALRGSKGLQIRMGPPDLIDALRNAREGVANEAAAADRSFKRIYDNFKAFRESYVKGRDRRPRGRA